MNSLFFYSVFLKAANVNGKLESGSRNEKKIVKKARMNICIYNIHVNSKGKKICIYVICEFCGYKVMK